MHALSSVQPSHTHFSGLMNRIATPSASSSGLLTGLAVSTVFMVPVKVFTAYKAYDWQGFTSNDKRLLLTQEIARQATSTALWMSSLAASWGLSGQLVGPKQHLARFLSANLMASIVDSVARPFITAVATKHLLAWQGKSPQHFEQITKQKPLSKLQTPPHWASAQGQLSSLQSQYESQTPRVQYVV